MTDPRWSCGCSQLNGHLKQCLRYFADRDECECGFLLSRDVPDSDEHGWFCREWQAIWLAKRHFEEVSDR